MSRNLAMVWISLLAMIAVPAWIAISAGAEQGVPDPGSERTPPVYGPDPGPFVENKGQWEGAVLFGARTSYGHVGLYEDGICHMIEANGEEVSVGISFEGISRVVPYGSNPLPTKYNYLLGNDRSEWGIGCRGFGHVTYPDLWPGIDLVFKGDEGRLKYDLVLRPGSDPDAISMKVHGCQDVESFGDDLRVYIDQDDVITDSGLRAYYQDNGAPLEASFIVDGGSFSFSIPDIDETRTVIIDPEVNRAVLEFGTYVGDSGDDTLRGFTTDRSGCSYLCGHTDSVDYPTTADAYQRSPTGNYDCYVTKLDARGGSATYSTYIGGADWDYCHDIAVDENKCVYIVGSTGSKDFPVTDGAYSSVLMNGSFDAFVLKLNDKGSGLVASTIIGGSDTDGAYALDIDGSGNAYVVGDASSADFPLTGDAYQNTRIDNGWYPNDLVIFKMDLINMELIYSTYLGGTN